MMLTGPNRSDCRALLGLSGGVRLLLAVACALLLTMVAGGVAWAAPHDTVAQRDRDEDVRLERFGPPAVALVGIVGTVVAARRRRLGLARALRMGTPLLALVLALVPLVMIGPRPLNRQPSPDAQEYADAARHLAAGEGYFVTIRRGEVQPSRYPPGFALALAPFGLAGAYPANVQTGAKLYAMLYLVITVAAAWIVAGPVAAAVAIALVGSSPFAVRYASLVMSDAFAAALTVAMLPLVHVPTTRRLLLAGLVAAALLLVRLSGILTIVAALAAVVPHVGWRGRTVLLAGGALGVALLGLQQWWTFGNPLMTGYQYALPEVRTFGLDYPFDPDQRRDGSGVVADSLDGALLRWVCPCPEDDPLFAFPGLPLYVLVILGLFWIFVPPLTTIPGLLEIWERRREPGPTFVLWLTILTVIFHVFYWYLGARFVAGPVTLLAIYTGAWVARRVARWEVGPAAGTVVRAKAANSA